MALEETVPRIFEPWQWKHRATVELLQEAADHLVIATDWLEGRLTESLSAMQPDETVADIRAWLESRARG